jgi:plastocyanin
MIRYWKTITTFFTAVLLLGGSLWFSQEGRISIPTSGQIKIEIHKDGFKPAQLNYKEGEEISLYVINKDNVVHNFIVPEFRIFSANLEPGETTTLSFQAIKKGEFGYFSDAPGFPEPDYIGEMRVE